MKEIIVKVHEITSDGLPDMSILVGRVAFIFDGCVVSGWPLREGQLWEANSDVGHRGPFAGVTHWLEFSEPVWELASQEQEGSMPGEWEQHYSLRGLHRCELPGFEKGDAGPGSIWKCSCGNRWQVQIKIVTLLAAAFAPLPSPLTAEHLTWILIGPTGEGVRPPVITSEAGDT